MKKTILYLIAFICTQSAMAQFGNWGASKDANPKVKEICAAHQIIAVLPFGTNYEQKAISKNAGKKEKERIDSKQFSLDCQKNAYTYFVKLKEKKDVEVNIQHPDTTNRVIDSLGLTYDSLMAMNYSDLCALFNVDAVVRGFVDVDKYMTKGGTVAMNMFVGGAPPDETVDCTLAIWDRKTGEQVWYYSNSLQGDLFSKPEKLINALLMGIGKKLPYFKK